MNRTFSRAIVLISLGIGVVGFAAAQQSGSTVPGKGRIPEEAFSSRGINLHLVPDYIVAYARDGEVCGYVRKADLFGNAEISGDRIEVVDETLETVVGHMVSSRGFVPLGTPEESVPAFQRADMPDSEE